MFPKSYGLFHKRGNICVVVCVCFTKVKRICRKVCVVISTPHFDFFFKIMNGYRIPIHFLDNIHFSSCFDKPKWINQTNERRSSPNRMHVTGGVTQISHARRLRRLATPPPFPTPFNSAENGTTQMDMLSRDPFFNATSNTSSAINPASDSPSLQTNVSINAPHSSLENTSQIPSLATTKHKSARLRWCTTTCGNGVTFHSFAACRHSGVASEHEHPAACRGGKLLRLCVTDVSTPLKSKSPSARDI
mmetsp:Transcript_29302/g.35694  ORF Transcript_29302/g.35694 Transcript_29302/m.35694 type:complete len:247 (-) Transcript_29302:995-1735(-)